MLPNGNGIKDAGENDFIRQPAEAMLDTVFVLGATDKIEIWTLSVNGNTNRSQHDLNLNLANTERDENPGSIISLVRYGDFEYLTTGDATTDDWKVKPDTEEAVIDADAIPGGNDIDVLIVAHHGSDTSNGKVFIQETAPEVAIISSTLTRDHIPKKTTLRVLREYNALVLVTGNAHNEAGNYHESGHAYDNGWSPSSGVLDNQGWIEISVHPGGESYMVEAEKGATRYYSSIDHTP